MTVVTVDEVVNYLSKIKLTGHQRGIVESVILPGVQQELENHLNRPIEPVLVRESLRADGTGWVYFRVTPVHEILSVTLSDGTDITPDPVTVPVLDNPTDMREYDEWGNPELYKYQVGVGIGVPVGYYPLYSGGMVQPYYRLEYIAGYNGYVNDALKLDILRIAARETEMMFDDTMSLRGGNTEAASDSDSREKGWTQAELTKWDRLRRRVVA
jgi:hypothetical protein